MQNRIQIIYIVVYLVIIFLIAPLIPYGHYIGWILFGSGIAGMLWPQSNDPVVKILLIPSQLLLQLSVIIDKNLPR